MKFSLLLCQGVSWEVPYQGVSHCIGVVHYTLRRIAIDDALYSFIFKQIHFGNILIGLNLEN